MFDQILFTYYALTIVAYVMFRIWVSSMAMGRTPLERKFLPDTLSLKYPKMFIVIGLWALSIPIVVFIHIIYAIWW